MNPTPRSTALSLFFLLVLSLGSVGLGLVMIDWIQYRLDHPQVSLLDPKAVGGYDTITDKRIEGHILMLGPIPISHVSAYYLQINGTTWIRVDQYHHHEIPIGSKVMIIETFTKKPMFFWERQVK